MHISGVTLANRKQRNIKRNVILGILIVLFLGVVAVFGISGYIGWGLVHPKKEPIPKFSSNIVIEYKDVEFEDIQEKIKLKGWYFKAIDSDKVIVLSHGYTNNRLQFKEKTLDMVKKFQENGFNVLMFDFRAAGISEGDICTVGVKEKDDLLGAIDYVKEIGNKHITLMGFSMGASTAITTAAASSDVDAVIADSPFSDLEKYLDDNLTFWSDLPEFPFNNIILFTMKSVLKVDLSKVSPKRDIKKVASRPVMLIHGKKDTAINIKNSEEIYNAYKEVNSKNITFWKVEDAGHVGSYEKNPDEYMKNILKFLGKVYAEKK